MDRPGDFGETLRRSDNRNDSALSRWLPQSPRGRNAPQACILPSVSNIVATATTQHSIAQGLLTGNLRQGAETKLGHLNLWAPFPFGAFADDAENRNDLGPFALRRTTPHCRGNFRPERVFVIGDTPHDIACGKIIGAQAISAATGRCSIEKLRAHNPTAVFENLADADSFFALIS